MDARLRPERKLSTKELMLLNCGVGEDSWESLGLHGDPTSPSSRRSVLSVHWKDWYWSWNSNILTTWCEKLTHLKRPWCWERLRAGREGDDRGWDSWMASLIHPVMNEWWHEFEQAPGHELDMSLSKLQELVSQRVGHNWATELNWTESYYETTEVKQGWVEFLLYSRQCATILQSKLSFNFYNNPGP